jgi:hypothetical protein
MLAATSFPAVDSSPLIHPGLPCPCIHPPQRHVGQQRRRHTLLHGHKQFPCVLHKALVYYVHGMYHTCTAPTLHCTSGLNSSPFLPFPCCSMLLLMVEMFNAMFSALKIPLPLTIMFAPAFAAMSIVAGFNPPSTSMSGQTTTTRTVREVPLQHTQNNQHTLMQTTRHPRTQTTIPYLCPRALL